MEGSVLATLDGVRVIELGALLAGPFAGRMLADMGAEVIKLEPPDRPDPMRDWGHARLNGRSLWWPIQSRNKKCISLNLREEKGQELLLRIIENADVVIENFRPGTLERWNLSFERMSEVNPRIILARISGFGQDGPYSKRAGFASVAEAMGGLRYINGFPDQPPPRSGISLGDSLASLFATQGILAALYNREATGGPGQVVDVSLLESCFALLESAVPEYDLLGVEREPTGTSLKGVAPSNIFRSSDDKWVVIAANHDSLFRRLCEAMGQAELADDPRFATHRDRAENVEALEEIVAKWASALEATEIDLLLNDAGVVCGPVYKISDLVADPHVRARDMVVEHQDPDLGTFLGPGVTPRFSRTPGAVKWTGPWEVGSHNTEIYEGLLGMSAEEISSLQAQGIV